MGTEMVNHIHFFRFLAKCNYESIQLLSFRNYSFLCWTST